MDALDAPFELDTHQAGGSEVFVHPSIGIALGNPDQTQGDVDELLRNADVAMYIAKGRGKRRYEFFEPSMHTGVLERLALKRDLSRAFERSEFVLHYQPIIDLTSSALVGLEALIRWKHPERGLVEPAAFVPLAEETGLIRPIGHWVLGEACARANKWGEDARGTREPLSVNVNLSPSQLQEPGLVGEVAGALARSGLAPSQLVLEITETVLMQDTEVTIRRLRRLKDLGVRLAIDDFGTGYSSLGYLQRFPIDIIKVAKPFVDNLERGKDESALVRAILKLADAFGLQTVAEGIEREAQLERLQTMGCALGQGFHFARPMNADKADALVRALPTVPSG
jgi:EAL domain-containing protein (putative c-di-GMP-specific phosphodiesterase class I)